MGEYNLYDNFLAPALSNFKIFFSGRVEEIILFHFGEKFIPSARPVVASLHKDCKTRGEQDRSSSGLPSLTSMFG